jgi:HlyD family secretion protein
MSKKWIFPLLALVGIVFAIRYVTSASPPPPVAQPVTQPANVAFDSYIGGAGLTESSQENIAIGTSRAGIVRHLKIEVGDKVEKGDVLFVMDDRDAQAALQQAKAQLQQAYAEVQNRRNQYTLVQNVTDTRAISTDEKNQRRDALSVAEASVAVAEASVKAAQVNVDLHTTRAPFDGVVLTKNIRVGEYAGTGQMTEPLLRLGVINPMHIRVDIDENDAWRFKDGAKAVAFVRGNPDIKVDLNFVRVEPYVRPKKSLTGDSTERVDTRVLQLIYAFDPTDKPIYVGQQMDVYIEVK